MTQEPHDEKPKRTELEWTFSMEAFGEGLQQLLSGVGIGAHADLQTIQLTEPLDDAARATIRLELTIGRVTLSALPPESDNLIEVDVTSIGAVEMAATTEGDTKQVRLRQKRRADNDIFAPVRDAVDAAAHNTELQWVIRLSPRIPLTLDIQAGFTLDQFDLSGLNVPRIELDGGAGKTDVIFPKGSFNADVDGGVGILNMTVPDGARGTLNVDIGAGATELKIWNASLKTDIEGGVGNCEVEIPAGIALRVQGESGLGNIDVPERAVAVNFESEFISESGTWQTHDFEAAAKKIDIRYEGGVGSLIVRERVPLPTP